MSLITVPFWKNFREGYFPLLCVEVDLNYRYRNRKIAISISVLGSELLFIWRK